MRRRDFIAGTAVSAIVWPFAVRAQQSAVPVVGFLNGASAQEYAYVAVAFRQGLNEAGYVEGRNVAIEYRWADGQYDRLPALADDLVRRQVAVIAANSPAAIPARDATTKIPIVFTVGFDPVVAGLVTSLSRPGGNLTGVTSLNVEIGPKRLELLHELVPTTTIVAALINPGNPDAKILASSLLAAASTLGLKLHILHASSDREFDTIFANLRSLHVGALLIGNDAYFISRSQQLAALTLRYAIPTIFQYREFTAAGGLMSYGGNVTNQFRLIGVYAGRILKGEKPADLPVQQTTKVELIVNLRTAKALGLSVSLPLLGRADEVIE